MVERSQPSGSGTIGPRVNCPPFYHRMAGFPGNTRVIFRSEKTEQQVKFLKGEHPQHSNHRYISVDKNSHQEIEPGFETEERVVRRIRFVEEVGAAQATGANHKPKRRVTKLDTEVWISPESGYRRNLRVVSRVSDGSGLCSSH